VLAETGSGIVYVPTRRLSVELATDLTDLGVPATSYHGGLGARPRTTAHDAFMSGRRRVVVATSAFGMGIDKPDVRFVYHLGPSDSVDEYFQEVGRAGRDGEPARAVLHVRPQDFGLRRFFSSGADPTAAEIGQLLPWCGRTQAAGARP
jgi:ATP-dependent DNA helicase RecQ